MLSRTIRLALTVSALAVAAGANAQAFNNVTAGAAPTTSVVTGTSTTTTTGDSSVSPFQNTTTTVLNQVLNSTTAATTAAVGPVTVNGNSYNGTITVSGTGSQNQTVTGTRVDTFTPGNPPTLASSVETPGTPVNVGSATVTAVSASGFVGSSTLANNYQATLATSGAVTNGTVVATENATTFSPTGVTFAQRVGTATYNPTTGNVTVTLPTAATSSTAISSTGITTTGGVTAASFTTAGAVTSGSVTTGAVSATSANLNGGRITNVGNGTATTDAVNLGQLNTAVGNVQTALTSAVATLNGTINNVQRRADAGTAVAVALGGGYFLPGKKVALTVNYGNYRGESAIAGSIGYLVTDNVALNAGIATGFNGFGGTAVRAGASFGF